MGPAHFVSVPSLPVSTWHLFPILSYGSFVQLNFNCNFDVVMEEGEHSVYYPLYHLERKPQDFYLTSYSPSILNFFWFYELSNLLVGGHHFPLVSNKPSFVNNFHGCLYVLQKAHIIL